MENNIFSRVLKNEEFWTNVKNISPFIATFSLVVGGFDQDIFRIYYQLVALVLFGIAAIADVLAENTYKEIHELKRYMFWRIIGVFILTLAFALTLIFFPDNAKIFPIAILSLFVLFIIITIFFKERLKKSNNIFKYLVDDEPPLFSKKYFEKTGKGTIVLRITLILFIIVLIVFTIGFAFFQWETFFNVNSP